MADSRRVDVIVPVYKGIAETRACIESVLAHPQSTPFEPVVVDDASPLPELSAYLAHLATQGRITLLRNDRNLGFVASVNRGMSLHPDRDVILLNSDTEVANDWLDRLRRCAYGQADIGTVTPFSNNATICSYPFDGWTGDVPGSLDLSALDRLVARANAGCSVDLPTAVGFCMYIRRACLDRVGMFDEQRFGRGYGEENDFSMRAARAGWRSVLAADIFVLHRGGVSFGEERRFLQRQGMSALLDAHPDYLERVGEFCARDPVAPLRKAIDEARAAVGPQEQRHLRLERRQAHGRAARPGPVQLHVTHSWGGGTERWIADFCKADGERRNLVLRSISDRNFAAWRLDLLYPSRAQGPLMTWTLERPIRATDVSNAEYEGILDSIIDQFGIQAVLISSLAGHALDLLETGLPTVVVLHDLYPFCPAMFAHFGAPCVECTQDALASCMRKNPYNVFWHNTTAADWLALREAYARQLAHPWVRIAAPTRSARDHWAALFPAVAGKAWQRIAHGLDLAEILGDGHGAVSEVQPGTKLRIVVPGSLVPHKGLGLLKEALPMLLEHADILLLGCGAFGKPFEATPGVVTVPSYTHAELAGHLRQFSPDCALLLSCVPESFSYTLSEMFALDVPVLATRLGAFAERIDHGGNGLLFDPDPASLSALIAQLARDRAILPAIRERLRDRSPRGAAEMVRDYQALLPAVRHCAQSGRMAAADDRLVEAALERARLARERAGLERRAGEASARAAELAKALSEEQARGAALEARVGALAAEREAIYRSRSWRWTAPLRAISGSMRRLLRAASRDAAASAKGAGTAARPGPAEAGGMQELRSADRSISRRDLRERLHVPDAARIVLSLLRDGSPEIEACFVRMALAIETERNDVVFVEIAGLRGKDFDANVDLALLKATGKLHVLPDVAEAEAAVEGADVVLVDHSHVPSVQSIDTFLEKGAKVIVFGPADTPKCPTYGAVCRVSIDSIESVPAALSDWFGPVTGNTGGPGLASH